MNHLKKNIFTKIAITAFSSVMILSTSYAAETSQPTAPTQSNASTAIAVEGAATSIINFLSNAMHQVSDSFAQAEQSLFGQNSEDNNKKQQKNIDASTSNLVTSELAHIPSLTGSNVLTPEGLLPSQSDNALYYSGDTLQKFLCPDGANSSTCHYNPKKENALLLTLTGSPSASDQGGLMAADNIISDKNAKSISAVVSLTGDKPTSVLDNRDKTQYLNYSYIFGNNQPTSLLPAKYYGLFLTKAYEIPMILGTKKGKAFLQSITDAASKKNGLADLRKTNDYRKLILSIRYDAAVTSALMDNILSMAKERTVTVAKDKSPTGKAMTQLEADKYIANHRLEDPDWINRIKQATPAELMREQTLMMAESLHQQYQNRMLMERNLTTLTIIAGELKSKSNQAALKNLGS